MSIFIKNMDFISSVSSHSLVVFINSFRLYNIFHTTIFLISFLLRVYHHIDIRMLRRIQTSFLSRHLRHSKPRDERLWNSPFLSFSAASPFGMFFRNFLTVPTTFVLFFFKLKYKLGEEYQLSINKVYPFPKNGSIRSITIHSEADISLALHLS